MDLGANLGRWRAKPKGGMMDRYDRIGIVYLIVVLLLPWVLVWVRP